MSRHRVDMFVVDLDSQPDLQGRINRSHWKKQDVLQYTIQNEQTVGRKTESRCINIVDE